MPDLAYSGSRDQGDLETVFSSGNFAVAVPTLVAEETWRQRGSVERQGIGKLETGYYEDGALGIWRAAPAGSASSPALDLALSRLPAADVSGLSLTSTATFHSPHRDPGGYAGRRCLVIAMPVTAPARALSP